MQKCNDCDSIFSESDYVKNEGCPYCGSDNVEFIDVDKDKDER